MLQVIEQGLLTPTRSSCRAAFSPRQWYSCVRSLPSAVLPARVPCALLRFACCRPVHFAASLLRLPAQCCASFPCASSMCSASVPLIQAAALWTCPLAVSCQTTKGAGSVLRWPHSHGLMSALRQPETDCQPAPLFLSASPLFQFLCCRWRFQCCAHTDPWRSSLFSSSHSSRDTGHS